MDLRVIPRVVYNRIVSTDHQVVTGPWMFSASAGYDNPDDNGGPLDHTSQQVRGSTFFAGSVTRRLGDKTPYAPLLKVSALKIHGGDAPDRGPYAGKETLFDCRF